MTASERPRRLRECAFRPVGDDGGLVVLPGRAEVKVLNPVAILVFRLLDGSRTLDEIASAVVEEFEVDHARAREDVEGFVRQLDEHDMLESGAPAGEATP